MKGASTPRQADRNVGCEFTFSVVAGTVLALQIAPATTAGTILAEALAVTLDGHPVERPVSELALEHGGRTHVVCADEGRLHIGYTATVRPAEPAAPPATDAIDAESITFLRQSRPPWLPSVCSAGELGHRHRRSRSCGAARM